VDTLIGTIWVCQCCMLSHANGECCTDDDHGGDGIPPWSSLERGYTMTMGLLDEEHECHDNDGNRPDECDCERDTFSKSRCDGCGSWLAGERQAFALWRNEVRPTVS